MYRIPPSHSYTSASTAQLAFTDHLSSCAAINGINQTIVSRANELATLSARGENLVAACALLSAEEAQVLGEAV